MQKKKLNSQGFGLVGILIVVLVLVIAGGAGYFVRHKDHKAKTAANAVTTSNTSKTTTQGVPTQQLAANVVSTSDGKVQVTLPEDWKVDSQYLHNAPAVIGVGDKTNCLNVDDPSPCLYQASFLPAAIVSGTYGSLTSGANLAANNSWSLIVEKTQWSISQAVSQVGSFSSADLIVQNDDSVNGYTAHFVKGYYGVPHSNQSGMAYYIIEHGGYLAVFSERILPVNGQDNPVTLFSSVDAEFAKIAQSIKFN